MPHLATPERDGFVARGRATAAIRVLCVEDDPLLRAYLAARLEMEPDVEVRGLVATAGEALTFLREEPVDVILLDYQLDGADGLQLLRAITRGADCGAAT